ncbi:bidirectional sugar transporter SWEET4-like [Hordeum vulgare subsp. vulgare]|uniref:bidirectional sugar transporter SWEET4-like n=1 Tax=Hordeum vulgare subsp. vulgare TaxID=112509 RepID=UPI001D1A4768|nr:bidirectional sugar transporter SWEET4-like [Hordeum vulgare subsp. vulgare]
MVIPVWKERSVGDRKVYGHVLLFFNSVMWTLYASTDLPNKLLLFIISGMGIIVHFFYTTFYITFAEPENRRHAVIILSAFLVVALITAVLVASMVLITHTWSNTFVDVMASISGASTQIVPAYDLVMVIMKIKQINDMNPVIMAVISLLSACTWAPYGFMTVPVNPYVVVPNIIGIVSTVTQITVYSCLLYRKTRIHSAQKEVELSASPV